jgi:hypothetical protein
VGIEGHHVTDEIKHPPSALIGEAASLFYLLGGMAAKHLVIVGGLVPPLLVPEATGQNCPSTQCPQPARLLLGNEARLARAPMPESRPEGASGQLERGRPLGFAKR